MGMLIVLVFIVGILIFLYCLFKYDLKKQTVYDIEISEYILFNPFVFYRDSTPRKVTMIHIGNLDSDTIKILINSFRK